MKKEYPNYRSKGVAFIEDQLPSIEKKILKDFLIYCGGSAGEKKVREYRICLLQIRDIMEQPLNKIKLGHLREFLAILNNGYQRDWTKQGIKVCLKKFLKFQYPDWFVRFSNLEDVKLGKPSTQDKYNESTLITEDEVKRMIKVSDSFRDKSFFSLSMEVAIRPDEIRNLQFRQLNDDCTTVTLFSGKKKEARTLPCKSSSVWLNKWKDSYTFGKPQPTDYVFPSTKGTIPLSSGATWYLIKRTAKKAGIEKNVFGYLLRHAKLNELYKKLPMQIHRKFAGHSKDSRQTATYEHLNSKDLMEALAEISEKELTDEQEKEIRPLVNKLMKDVEKLQLDIAKRDNQELKKMKEDLKGGGK